MSSLGTFNESRQSRWYFGSLAAAFAACVTHPLDLLKVLLQTQSGQPLTLIELTKKVFQTEGIMGFYNGLSASVMRQVLFMVARIGIYENFKYDIPDNNAIMQLGLAFGAAICGAVVGMPAEVANVRMQSDMHLPREQRRKYKHVLDGIARIIKEEGYKTLFDGTLPNIMRGVMMTVTTNVVYDQVKYRLLDAGMKDNVNTHITCSVIAICSGTTISNPIDVVKTRMMTADPYFPKGIRVAVRNTAKQGPMAFYKGYIPSLARITPQYTLVFVIMEQLRLYFGYLPPTAKK